MEPPAVILTPIVGFLLLWFGVWFVIARMGWSKLASIQTSGHLPSTRGRKFRMQSVRIGWANYNNCITIHVDDYGMYLSMLVFFRFMHPPIFIPWRMVSGIEQKQTLGFSHPVLQIGHPSKTTIRLSNKVMKEIEEKGHLGHISTDEVKCQESASRRDMNDLYE